MIESMKIALAGETEAGSAEVQPARDSPLKATNGRWGGSPINLPSRFTNRAIQSIVMP